MIRYCTSLLPLVIVALSSTVSTATSAAVDHKVVDRLLTQLEVLNNNKKSLDNDKNSNDIKMLMEIHRLLTDIEKLNDSRKLPGDDKEDDKKDEKKDDEKKKEDDKKGGKDEQENDVNGITDGENGASSKTSYQIAMMFGLVISSAVSAMLF